MIVVSDTSPITALITVGHVELLNSLFGEVVIPEAVQTELLRTHTDLPAWIRIIEVRDIAGVSIFTATVDPGEAEAIQLAKEIGADRILIDERRARNLAVREGLAVIGLLGVVVLSRERKLIQSARGLLDRLYAEAGIYLAEELKEQALNRLGE